MSAGYLLDTSVVSLLAPGRSSTDEALVGWVRDHNDALFVSAVTMSEIEQGICKLRRAGGTDRADALTRWLDALIDSGGDRILSFDARIGRIAGTLSDRAIAAGRHPGFADIAIAATALAHDLLLLTGNGKHFAPLGIAFNDPAEGLPT
ncbi:MAG: VapC toxin family PIN domain ribonuclease [Tagaea sp. CACIAM 22H2]|nr:VapC toxin family PIN domain ribonuclease [Tagaea sp. CACIAM 22H2]